MEVTEDDDALLAAFQAIRPSQTDLCGRSLEVAVRRNLVDARGDPFRLGRFTVMERIGGGGMGTVFVAYDPDLDRKIALKVLHSRGEAGRQAALREGRALARLRHPGVVTVFEVGVLGDQVFVAMEYISGQNLREWLRGSPPRASILARLIEAGRGLAAAHDVELVHHDVKPDNVVLDVDGHARVIDFGLARPSADAITGPGDMAVGDTTTPSRCGGTPAYMAPERLAGGAGDHRSDLYAFCVTCWEALTGERPPREGTPSAAGIPGRLVRILRRGLAPDPAQRFPSMHALLAELAPRPRRWRTAGLVAVALGGLTIGALAPRDPAPPRCTSPWVLLAGTWSPARAEALGAAFEASDAPFARETWASVRPRLERHAAAWIDAHTRACTETAVLGVAPPELYERRVLCLADRRLRFAALLDRLAAADPEAIARAHAAIDELPPIDDCDRPGPGDLAAADPRELGERLALREERARASAALDTGDFPAAAARIDRLLARARVGDEPALLADALLLAGRADQVALRFEAARPRYREALRLAIEVGQPYAAAQAAIGLARCHDGSFEGPTVGDELLALAEAFTRQAGDPPRLRLALQHARGNILQARARFVESAASLAETRRLALELDEPIRAAWVLLELGVARDGLGDYAAARAAYRQALAELEPLLGPLHPALAGCHNNLASASLAEGDDDAALHHLERSAAIVRANFGEVHSLYAAAKLHLGTVRVGQGAHAEALAAYREAAGLFERLHGPAHPHFALATCAAAEELRALERPDEALGEVERAAAVYAERLPSTECDRLACAAIHGAVLHDLGRHADAVALLEVALDDAAAGPCAREQRGELELQLARALWGLRGRRERARILGLLAATGDALRPGSAEEIARLRAALR